VAAGELVLVDLAVVTPAPREYVVVDDALPAGLEAIDPKLFTTADWLKNAGFATIRAARIAVAATVKTSRRATACCTTRSEVRDDRVLFFSDELPAGLSHFRYLARAATLGHFVLPPPAPKKCTSRKCSVAPAPRRSRFGERPDQCFRNGAEPARAALAATAIVQRLALAMAGLVLGACFLALPRALAAPEARTSVLVLDRDGRLLREVSVGSGAAENQ